MPGAFGKEKGKEKGEARPALKSAWDEDDDEEEDEEEPGGGSNAFGALREDTSREDVVV